MWEFSSDDIKAKIAAMESIGTAVREKIERIEPENYTASKNTELWHVGKFLYHEKDYTIEVVSESPDFILEGNGKRVGVELSVMVDDGKKQIESFKQSLVKAAVEIFKKRYNTEAFLANVYLKDDHYLFSKKQVPEVASKIADEIYRFYCDETTDPETTVFVEDVARCPAHDLDFDYNPGAYMVAKVTVEHLGEIISKKERLMDRYQKAECDEYWLLIVTDNGSSESFFVEEEILKTSNIACDFDRVYVMEDFKNKLYRLT